TTNFSMEGGTIVTFTTLGPPLGSIVTEGPGGLPGDPVPPPQFFATLPAADDTFFDDLEASGYGNAIKPTGRSADGLPEGHGHFVVGSSFIRPLNVPPANNYHAELSVPAMGLPINFNRADQGIFIQGSI